MQLNTQRSPKKPTAKRASLRDQYLQEKEHIKLEFGDLEQMRISMGLSQRRMCQLLLVDPSAWTRWCKTLEGAPPHIYQALKWLLKLTKMDPETVAPGNILKRLDLIESNTQNRMRELEGTVSVLERSVALSSTVQPAAPMSAPQERRLSDEIATLKLQIALLLENGNAKTVRKAKIASRARVAKKEHRKKATKKIKKSGSKKMKRKLRSKKKKSANKSRANSPTRKPKAHKRKRR